MTIKELYEKAKENGAEDYHIMVDRQCSDEWYNYYGAPINTYDDEDAIVFDNAHKTVDIRVFE